MKTTTTTDSLTMSVRDLRALLTGMRKVVDRKSKAQVLRHLLFRFGAQVVVSGSNGKVHLDYLAGTGPGGVGELLVPIEALADLGRELSPSENVSFELKRSMLVVSAGSYRRKIRSAGDPVEYPLASHRGTFLEFDDELRAAFLRALACASSDPTRDVLNGVFLEPTKKGLEVVGTDGRGLYHAGPFDHPLKKALIVPATPVLGWKGLKESWSIRISGRKGESPFVSIRSGQWTVTAKAIDGKYPAWREVIPRYRGTTILLPDPSATSRLLRLLPGDIIGIECRKHVSLLAREEGNWNAHRVDGASCSGPPAQVFLASGFLRRALQFGMSELKVGDAQQPVVFTGQGRLIVMPMRVSNPPELKK
ncbi:MAG: hypothetical protein ACKJSK_19645 [Roseibacillus sp.]